MLKKRITWIIFALLLGTVIFWWTTAKNRIVKQAITKTVSKKTDSLYRIHYDTAMIDEVGGNVVLQNLRIELDSIQWLRLVQKDSMPTITLSLSVDKVTVNGLKELKLLSNRSLDLSAVVLDHPVLRLEHWKRKQPPPEGFNDTLELYQRLTGNFDFLRARTIQVKNGSVRMLDYSGKDSLSAEGIDIGIDNFLVDSLHNYRNVIAYFIRQAHISAKSFHSKEVQTGNIDYNSQQQTIQVANLSIGKDIDKDLTIKLISFTGFSADSFVNRNMFYTRKAAISFPSANIKPSAKKGSGLPPMFSFVSIDSLVVNQGHVVIKPGSGSPTTIHGIDLVLKKIKIANGQIQAGDYMNANNCWFLIAGVRMQTELHEVVVNKIAYPGTTDRLSINSLEMRPRITPAQLKSKVGIQNDLYTVTAKNILLDKLNLKMLLHDTISVARASAKVDIHVFDDKTLPANTGKKYRDKFPYEKLSKSKTMVDIRELYVDHSRIAYEEEAPKSGQRGTVFFTDVTGKVANITNMAGQLKKDHMMTIGARARLMGGPKLNSEWRIDLADPEAGFQISGGVDPFALSVLNPAFEPLGMASFRSGSAEKLLFTINGNHKGSTGNVVFNYRNLKVDLLKKGGSDSLTKRGFKTLLANVDIRNNNHLNGGKTYHFEREQYRSFFYLIWKSVFQGAKENVLIVK